MWRDELSSPKHFPSLSQIYIYLFIYYAENKSYYPKIYGVSDSFKLIYKIADHPINIQKFVNDPIVILKCQLDTLKGF